MIRSIATILRRKLAARRLGVRLGRSRDFTVPATLRLGGKPIVLQAPRDAGTIDAFIDVFLDDCYRLRSISPAPRTIIDIGAHAGFFSLCARHEFPSAVIHGYEPNPSLAGYLAANAGQTHVAVFSEAVGEKGGTVLLEIGEGSVHTRTGARGIPVPQTAFREAVQRLGGAVDLVKMDCEGAEWEILKDVEAWRRVGMLTMEYHLWAGYTLAQLCSAIERTGLDVRRFDPPHKDYGLLFAQRRA